MPVRAVRNYTAPLRWDSATARYRDARGRFVPYGEVEQALNRALDRSRAAMRRASNELRDGNLTLAQWQRRMTDNLRGVHVTSGALAAGGIPRLTPEDLATIRATIRSELGYLQRFARGIEDGNVPLNGTFLNRAEMYVRAGRGTYYDVRGGVMLRAGFDQERNRLGVNERHCVGCNAESAKGWVPIGTLVRVGARNCLSACLCVIIYLNSATGQETL